jgi:ribosomal protein L32
VGHLFSGLINGWVGGALCCSPQLSGNAKGNFHLLIVLCRLVVRLQAAHHAIKCILCGENTLVHWTTKYCFVQGDWQCTLTTNLQSTIERARNKASQCCPAYEFTQVDQNTVIVLPAIGLALYQYP